MVASVVSVYAFSPFVVEFWLVFPLFTCFSPVLFFCSMFVSGSFAPLWDLIVLLGGDGGFILSLTICTI